MYHADCVEGKQGDEEDHVMCLELELHHEQKSRIVFAVIKIWSGFSRCRNRVFYCRSWKLI